MKPEDEHKKFRDQYRLEWRELESRSDFMAAFNADDFVKMGEIAAKIVEGEADTIEESKLVKFLKKMEY